jgi:proteic killer suppression protein
MVSRIRGIRQRYGIRACQLAIDVRYVTRYSSLETSNDPLDPAQGSETPLEEGNSRSVLVEHVVKLGDILARLDAAGTVDDLEVPGFHLHPLKGELKGFWAVTVRANWRVIFRFVDGDAVDVDYIDYH